MPLPSCQKRALGKDRVFPLVHYIKVDKKERENEILLFQMKSTIVVRCQGAKKHDPLY